MWKSANFGTPYAVSYGNLSKFQLKQVTPEVAGNCDGPSTSETPASSSATVTSIQCVCYAQVILPQHNLTADGCGEASIEWKQSDGG